jgi:eukaryotic-like serine/threonine-protein kinase
MADHVVSHYELIEEIGRGGMGVVFKAKDINLNRLVAIKFLPSHLTRDTAFKNRFLREAQVASCLEHPNICTIHEVDENKDGELFLVMAYYEGQTLAAKIRAGMSPCNEAIQITLQILEGLDAAHKLGVVHRDIKPANVIVTVQGEIKIVDFGLAKITRPTEFLTETGAMLGTVAYMSPEQAHGQSVDARTDLWGAAVILYELLTGQPPFKSESLGSLINAITYEDPISPLVLRSDLSPAIERILGKALAKDRTARYQSAREFSRELSSLQGVPSTTISKSTLALPPRPQAILVLPFANLDPDKESDYFSDGLTDEIITDLSAINSLRVICRTSAMRLKGTTQTLRKLASDLRVDYVLEGSVRKSSNSLRVSAELVDPNTDSLLWAEKYAGSPNDVFAIQEELSRKIVAALKLKLSPTEERKLVYKPLHDLRAYEYYLKAKHEILSYSKESLERASQYLDSGVRIVGRNILLTSAIGQLHWQFVNAGISTDPVHLEKARQCADEILSQDPDSPHGLRLLGLVHVSQGDTQIGVSLLKRALAGDPNDPDTLVWLTAVCGFSGKPHAVIPMAAKLLEIDPLTPSYQCLPGLLALMAGEFARAPEPFEKSLKMDPTNPMVRFCYAHVLALNHRMEEFQKVLDGLHRELPDNFFAKLGQFYQHALAGNRPGLLEHATEELLNTAGSDPHYCWNLAQGYALVNEKQQALTLLEQAVSLGFINYPLLSRMDPFLENLRSEPGFEALMQKTKQRWEAFDA